MRYSVLEYSNVLQQSDMRLDADFYSHPFRQKFLKREKRLRFSTLGKEIDFIGSGHTPYKHDVSSGEIPFITVECIGDLEFFDEKTKRITNEQYKSEYKNKIISKGSVVCTIKRRICKAYPFLSKTKKMALNQDVALIRPKANLLSGFLAVYFNCSFGQGLADSLKTEQMNPYISLVNLAKLPVPLMGTNFQKKIEDIVLGSQKIKSQSDDEYVQAQTILLSELGLAKWQPKHRLTFVKNYSSAQRAERIDAEYFQPKYEAIEEAIKSYANGHTLIRDVFRQNTSTFKIDDEKLYRYVEIGGMNVSNGEIIANEVLGADLPANAKRLLKKGDVIVSKVRTYRGAITIVDENGYVGSGAFCVLEENGQINKETLLAFLHSKPLLAWSLKPNTGTSYPVIVDDDILNLPIPILPKEKQDQIQQKVTESFNLRKQSKHLLECAKRAVEMAIEQDEQTAIDWLEDETGYHHRHN